MIRQIFADMAEDELGKAAFIQITAKDTLADVNKDLKTLEQKGFRYVFLDEVTLMEDFIEGAALFSDVFAACGMKIVLSGTDSLGFLFTEDEQLYDRCVMLHTTFIPYREFESVLGIHGIDEYIRYGGTMSLGGVHYNETSTFASKESADEYVDTAIARNIQHSLRCYQYEGHFRHLHDLYEKDELTSAINRVVEDINHRFYAGGSDTGFQIARLGYLRKQPASRPTESDGYSGSGGYGYRNGKSAKAAGNSQSGGTNGQAGSNACARNQRIFGTAGFDAGNRRSPPAGCQ